MVTNIHDPFNAKPGPTRAEQEAWEARKFGTVDFLRPMAKEESDQAIDKIARGIDDEQTRRYLEANKIRKPIITPAMRTQRFGGKRGRPRVRINSELVKAMYIEGMTVRQIAESQYLHVDTVRNHLKWLKIYDPGRDKTGGKGKTRNRQEKCDQGHELTEENVLWTRDSRTGRKKRECKTCKYRRNAEYKRRRRARSTSGEGASDGSSNSPQNTPSTPQV